MYMKAFAAAALLMASIAARADQVIVNGGLESGSLAPFTTDTRFGSGSIAISSTNCYAGNYCALLTDNVALKQTFAGVATNTISDVSFAIDSPYEGDAYDFFYSDGVDQEFYASNTGGSYSLVDATSNLRAGATLTGFEVFGFTSSEVSLDNVSITTATSATPEPSSFALLGTGLLSVAGLVRRRLA